MNTKKKFLSFALACLMLALTFSAAIPVFAADAVAQIGSTPYTDLDAAFEAAGEGQTVELLKSEITVTEIKTSNKNAFTVQPVEGLASVTITTTNDSIMSSGSTTSNSIVFNNVNFVQASKKNDNTDNTSAFMIIRGGSKYTFNNCTFTTGINTTTNTGFGTYASPFISNGSTTATNGAKGGELIMNDCTINYNNSTAELALFSSNTDLYPFAIKLNNVNINTSNKQSIFRMSSKMTVDITGTTTVKNNDGDYTGDFITEAIYNNAARHGGTVNILNGKTYGGFEAPTLVDGASVRTTAGSNGLRFKASLPASVIANEDVTEYGMLFARTASVSGEFTETALADGTYIMSKADTAKTVDGVFTFALTDIAEDNYNTMYSARAYAKYNSCKATILVYSTYTVADNSRSLAGVAKMATEDFSPTYDAENGYICKIADGKYSPYDKNQLAVLTTYADKYVAE